MEISLTTPSLLFPALSLLLLAYTNRFLGLASVVRKLHATYRTDPTPEVMAQIRNLRRRIFLIRQMQMFGVLSILLCTLCMLLVFLGWQAPAQVIFAASLVSMVISLGVSLQEVHLSGGALDLLLQDVEKSA